MLQSLLKQPDVSQLPTLVQRVNVVSSRTIARNYEVIGTPTIDQVVILSTDKTRAMIGDVGVRHDGEVVVRSVVGFTLEGSQVTKIWQYDASLSDKYTTALIDSLKSVNLNVSIEEAVIITVDLDNEAI